MNRSTAMLPQEWLDRDHLDPEQAISAQHGYGVRVRRSDPCRPKGYRKRNRKWNHLVNKVRGFMRSRCGLKWSVVFSEFSRRPEFLDENQKDGFLRSAQRVVSVNITIDKQDRLVDNDIPGCDGIYHPFFVDPRSGLLLRTPADQYYFRKSQRINSTAKKTHVIVGREIEFMKRDGIWYRIVFGDDIAQAASNVQICDSWQESYVFFGHIFRLHPGQRIRCNLRQCSSRELRKHGLANDDHQPFDQENQQP